MPTIDRSEAARLRAGAQTLQPALRVGKAGVTDAVLKELDAAFRRNPVVKVRLHGDREARAVQEAALVAGSGAESAGGVGGVLILRRLPPPAVD